MVGGGENAASIPLSAQTQIKDCEVRAGDVKQRRELKEKKSGGGGGDGVGGGREVALKAARLTRNLPVATLSGRAPNYCGSIDGAGIPSASSSRLRSLRAGSPSSAHTHTHTPIRKHCRPHTHVPPSTHGLIVALLRRLIETEVCVKGHKRYLVRPEEAAAAVTRQSEVGL